MESIISFWTYIQSQASELLSQTITHLGITFISLFFAIIIAVPLGLWITRQQKLAKYVLGFAGILQTIPSIALLGFMIPLLGIGLTPAIFALFLYALLPIIRNVYTGISEVDPGVKEAALGMGMTDLQILSKVELPLALPVIFAGIRTATVINVGVATLAAYIGAGGLGEFIFGGIALNNTQMMLAGAIPAAILAIVLDQGLAAIQQLKLARFIQVSFYLGVGICALLVLFYARNFSSSSIKAGFDPEFAGRDDGYPLLKEVYDLTLDYTSLNPTLMYNAIKGGEVDVISGYATDGRIKAYNLTVLTDDQQAFPPYDAAAMVNSSSLQTHPVLAPILNLLSGKITDQQMIDLNFQVDEEKQSPNEVALAFLITIGLLTPEGNAVTDTIDELYRALPSTSVNYAVPTRKDNLIAIGSKPFTEQYILVALFELLIEAYSNLEVDTKTGLGGTKICFEALKEGEIDLYPEYTGTGLSVILSDVSMPENKAQTLRTNQEVYQWVKDQTEKNFDITWLKPIGFNNTYALMMKREQAEAWRVKTISDLAKRTD